MIMLPLVLLCGALGGAVGWALPPRPRARLAAAGIGLAVAGGLFAWAWASTGYHGFMPVTLLFLVALPILAGGALGLLARAIRGARQ